MLDARAQKGVTGLSEARAHNDITNSRLCLDSPNKATELGNLIIKSLGTMTIRLPASGNAHIPPNINVINVEIPMFIRRDVLRCGRLLLNYLDHTLFWDTIETYPSSTDSDIFSWNGRHFQTVSALQSSNFIASTFIFSTPSRKTIQNSQTNRNSWNRSLHVQKSRRNRSLMLNMPQIFPTTI